MKRKNKDPFKELLKLIALRQNEDQEEVDKARFGEVEFFRLLLFK